MSKTMNDQTILLLTNHCSSAMARFIASLDYQFTGAIVVTNINSVIAHCSTKPIRAVVVDGSLARKDQIRALEMIRIDSRFAEIPVVRISPAAYALANCEESLFDATLVVGEDASILRREIYLCMLRRQLLRDKALTLSLRPTHKEAQTASIAA